MGDPADRAEREDEAAQAVLAYLLAEDQGIEIDRERLLREYPDEQEGLRGYLAFSDELDALFFAEEEDGPAGWVEHIGGADAVDARGATAGVGGVGGGLAMADPGGGGQGEGGVAGGGLAGAGLAGTGLAGQGVGETGARARSYAPSDVVLGCRIVEVLFQEQGPGPARQTFRALDEGDHEVVVKLQPLRAPLSVAERARFVDAIDSRRESLLALGDARLLAPLRGGVEPSFVAVLRDYAPGGTLAERLPALAGDPAAALAVLVPVCQALQRAHESGQVHGSISPTNLLFAVAGSAAPCLDFALLRPPLDEGVAPRVSMAAAYHPPERLRGGPASVAGDVYGVGTVLYELLFGRPAYAGVTPQDVMMNVLRGARSGPQPPAEGAPPFSLSPPGPPLGPPPGPAPGPALWAVCRRAMDPDPQRRYPTVAAVEEALLAAGSPPREEGHAKGGLLRWLGWRR